MNFCFAKLTKKVLKVILSFQKEKHLAYISLSLSMFFFFVKTR